jgi:hypothetical protein
MPRDFVGSQITGTPTGLTPGVLYLLHDAKTMIWSKGGSGGDSVLDLHADAAFTSELGMRMLPRTTSAAIGDVISASLEFSMGLGQFIKVRGRYSLLRTASIEYWGLDLYIHSGVREYRVRINLYPTDNQVYYRNADGTMTECPVSRQSGADGRWGSFDININIATGLYGKCYFDGFDLGIDGFEFLDEAASTLKYFKAGFIAKSLDALVPGLYIDDLIVVDQQNI